MGTDLERFVAFMQNMGIPFTQKAVTKTYERIRGAVVDLSLIHI